MSPINRRPGIDADIVQTNWVRGYDGPQLGDPPQDLLISTGQNAQSLLVSEILVWNRTDDQGTPIFTMLPGADQGLAPRFEIFAGALADPNGVLTASLGAIYISNNPSGFWQNTNGTTAWTNLASNLGGENLEETLAIGNFTGDNPIVLSNQPNGEIRGETGATGGPIRILAGAATGVGTGGSILIGSGSSTGAANTGNINIVTAPIPAGTANSGGVILATGNSLTGGNSGSLLLQSGQGLLAGHVTLQAGAGVNLVGNRGGSVQLFAGNTGLLGSGGQINIGSGSTGAPPLFPIVPVVGRAGPINIIAGNSTGTAIGGPILISGGTGGAGGAAGGGIILRGGAGGGGGAQGAIEADGIFSGTNYLRLDGDPNTLGVTAPEGSLFQRSTAGAGEAWLSVTGGVGGWAKLLTAGGGIVSALTQIQYGSLQASSDGINNELAADGTFYATVGAGPSQVVYQVSGSKTMSQAADFTPAMSVTALAGDVAGVYLDTNLSRNSKARVTFKVSVTTTSDVRYFIGFGQASFGNDVVQMCGTDNPPNNWFGVQKGAGDTNWRFRSQFAAQTSNTSSSVLVASDTYYMVFDLFPDVDGGVTVRILDESYNPLASHTYSPLVSLISNSQFLRPILGVGSNAGPKGLDIHLISVVSRIDIAESAFAGGLAGFAPPWASVLSIGPASGGVSPILTHGDFLLGEDDGNAGNGGTLGLFSGNTTGGGFNTGPVLVASATTFLAGFAGATGATLLSSGSVVDGTNTATGDTGNTTVATGASSGATGTIGNLILATGNFVAGGGGTASGGSILITANGAFGATTNSVPGAITITSGTTSVAGVTGGALDLKTGGNTVLGNSGNMLLRTENALSANGNSGLISITSGNGGATSGNSGDITIQPGRVFDAAATAGTLFLRGGIGAGGPGGDVVVSAGSGGVPGEITFGSVLNQDKVNLDSPAFKAGTLILAAGPIVAFPLSFNSGFAIAPRVVMLSLEGAPSGVAVTIDAGSILAAGCTVSASAVLGGPMTLHWTAWL